MYFSLRSNQIGVVRTYIYIYLHLMTHLNTTFLLEMCLHAVFVASFSLRLNVHGLWLKVIDRFVRGLPVLKVTQRDLFHKFP